MITSGYLFYQVGNFVFYTTKLILYPPYISVSELGSVALGRYCITRTIVYLLLIWSLETKFSGFRIKIQNWHSWKYIWKCRLWNGGHFIQGQMCSWTPLSPSSLRFHNWNSPSSILFANPIYLSVECLKCHINSMIQLDKVKSPLCHMPPHPSMETIAIGLCEWSSPIKGQ